MVRPHTVFTDQESDWKSSALFSYVKMIHYPILYETGMIREFDHPSEMTTA